MSDIVCEDNNILQAYVSTDNIGQWSVFFLLKDGNSESYFTADDLRKMLAAMEDDQ